MRFHVKNHKPSKDVAVWIEGIRNKLSAKDHVYYNGNDTFVFVTALEAGQTRLQMTLGEGDYEIQQVEAYRGSLPEASEASLYEAVFQVDTKQTTGNRMTGKIEMPQDGYLITSIPYAKGFTVQVDGRTVKTERVNTAFLGCRLEAGAHQVEIRYHAPGMKAGKGVSLAGILLAAALFLSERNLRRKKKSFT